MLASDGISEMLDKLTQETFADQLNTKFGVRLPDSKTIELQLYEVVQGHSTRTQEQFSLFFHGPRETNLGQGTFHLEHDRIGDFSIFLVPIGPDKEGMRYQAVFNRFREQPR
jgi:hypothetical protein